MAADARIGSTIAGYRIEALVGRGGMGVVYRAHDTALDRKVALKLISPDRADNPQFRERFLRESRIAASIDHANIVPIHDAGEYQGQLFIAMRYVDGTDLDALLADDGPLEPARALALVGQVASALDAAHARGLIHRDVKPANILVTHEMGRDEHVYLTDFGLSRDSGQRSAEESDQTVVMRASNSLGTIDYAAPEQIEGQATDSRTDIYALGCVLYQTLTGAPPFKATSPVATLFRHLSDEPPAASQQEAELDVEIDSVFGRALAKEPDERYESATAMIDAAQEALGERESFVQRLGPMRAALAAVVVIAAVTAITLAVTLTGGGGDGGGIRSAVDGLVRQPGTLSRIDPATNTVTASIGIGPEPNAVALGDDVEVPGEEQVWITHIGDNSIWRVDAETLETKKASANGTPCGITVGDGTFWVADEQVSSGSTHNALPGDPIATIHPTAISARGDREIWIAGPGGAR